jgi:hypothetical protein
MSPYKILSIWNDVKAVRKGPKAVAKRQARKYAYRETNKLLRRVLRNLGL